MAHSWRGAVGLFVCSLLPCHSVVLPRGALTSSFSAEMLLAEFAFCDAPKNQKLLSLHA